MKMLDSFFLLKSLFLTVVIWNVMYELPFTFAWSGDLIFVSHMNPMLNLKVQFHLSSQQKGKKEKEMGTIPLYFPSIDDGFNSGLGA